MEMTTNNTVTTESNDVEEWSCSGRQSISAEELLIRIYSGSSSLKAAVFTPIPFFIITTLLYIDIAVFQIRNSNNKKRMKLILWVTSTYPVLAASCIAGIFMPRAAGVITFGRNFYFVVMMKKFFDLMLNYYGGKQEMENALRGELVVPQNYFPCCFIVCCCRNQPMTVSRINKVKMTVYQILIVYPLSYYLITLLTAEGLITSSAAAQFGALILRFCSTISGFVCLYGFTVIGKSSFNTLRPFFIRGKYLSVSLVVACNTFQSFIIRFVDFFNGLSCGFPYPDPQTAFLIQNFLFTFELFILVIFAWISFKRPENDCKVKEIPRSNFSTIPMEGDPVSTHHSNSNGTHNGIGNGHSLGEKQIYLPEEHNV